MRFGPEFAVATKKDLHREEGGSCWPAVRPVCAWPLEHARPATTAATTARDNRLRLCLSTIWTIPQDGSRRILHLGIPV